MATRIYTYISLLTIFVNKNKHNFHVHIMQKYKISSYITKSAFFYHLYCNIRRIIEVKLYTIQAYANNVSYRTIIRFSF